MAIRPIYQLGAKVLRTRARPVGRVDKATRRLIEDMVETMRDADGVGLAAPQVGVTQRLFVAEVEEKVYVFINPRIVEASPEMETAEEGCLSIPGYRGEVERHARVTVRGKNRGGKEYTVDAEGLLARCLQHEIDHLDGVLYIDRMKPGAVLRPLDTTEDDDATGAAAVSQ